MIQTPITRPSLTTGSSNYSTESGLLASPSLTLLKTVPSSPTMKRQADAPLLSVHQKKTYNHVEEARSSNSRSKKRVTFDLSSPKLHFGRAELTEEENASCFWDSAKTKLKARKIALLYRKKHQNTKENDGASSSSTTPYEESYNQALALCSASGRIEIEKAPVLSASPCRGLEQFLVKRYNGIKIVRRILKAQEMLPAQLDAERQAALLCSVSKNLTRPARRMAQLLAIGDQQVAADSIAVSSAAA